MLPHFEFSIVLCRFWPSARFISQTRRLTNTARWKLADQNVPPTSSQSTPSSEPAAETHPLKDAPRGWVRMPDQEKFTPKPLLRPIGLKYPPTEGQNSGIDNRSFQQKKADFMNHKKHLEKRKELLDELERPYFRDWFNLQFHKGKIWVAPPRPFRSEVALFFPNFYGTTLVKGSGAKRDTTPLLRKKTSVVAICGSMWGEAQVDSFVSRKENEKLHKLLAESDGRVQLVRIVLEESRMKAWMISLWKGSLRRKMGEGNWDKFFLIRRGISLPIRESVGLLNSKLGYIFLVDRECKIRWAASGPAQKEEKENLVTSVERLLKEPQPAGVASLRKK